jgi:hypothetical protein
MKRRTKLCVVLMELHCKDSLRTFAHILCVYIACMQAKYYTCTWMTSARIHVLIKVRVHFRPKVTRAHVVPASEPISAESAATKWPREEDMSGSEEDVIHKPPRGDDSRLQSSSYGSTYPVRASQFDSLLVSSATLRLIPCHSCTSYLCIYTCIYIYMNTYLYTYIYIYIFSHTYTNACTPTCMKVQIYPCIPAPTFIHAPTYEHMHMCACVCVRVCVPIYTCYI